MSAVLHSITDPRDALGKLKRLELFRLAQENKITEIPSEQMPGDLMRDILRSKGIHPKSVPNRQLGTSEPTVTTPTSHRGGAVEVKAPDKIVEVSATADLARQWQQSREARPVAAMSITELRQECKRRNIKMARTDNMTTLKAKLNGE